MRKKILCVDDEPDVLDLVKLCLEADGKYEVSLCLRSTEALAKAVELRPDVILLDMMMPEMDGLAVIKQLQFEPRTRNIPVLFMTAKTKNSDLDMYLAMGALGVIGKPFDVEELPLQVGLIA